MRVDGPDTGPSALVPAIGAGDTSAMERLYDLHAPMVYALLLRLLGNPEDAQEVLQEVFVQAWQRAGSFDPGRGNEIAWLISIARSRGIDRLRSRRTRATRESEAGREISIRTGDVVRAQGLDDAIVSEQQQEMRAALEGIPDAQRIPLELAYFSGMSQSEIARHLGEPLGTIKTRMQLGMKKLRDRLSGGTGR